MNKDSANQTDPGKRTLRGHQPARALLLDVGHTLEVTIWHRVLSALHNLISIACNMAGPPRIPLFTIYYLDSYPEVMLPLLPPKGNLCRILTVLRDVKTCIEDSLRSPVARTTSCLSLGVMEACGQYRRYLNAMGDVQSRGSVHLDQLEVVAFSGASQSEIRKLLQGLDNQPDLTYLKRLVAVLLSGNSLEDSESPQSSISANSKEVEDSSIVDFLHLDTDDGSLQKFFYSWLLDSFSDSEHLHLLLPPASPADAELLVKCDLVERIINPAQLPHHECFSLHPDSGHSKVVFPCPSKAAGMTVPIYTLKVIAILPAQAVCDSIVFGLPLLVQATTCWRIDWEELEENSANFQSLSVELLNKNQVLLVRMETQNVTKSASISSRNQNQLPAPSVRGLFVLLPAPTNTLLLKAVATRELVLPASFPLAVGDSCAHSTLRVQSSLTQVPVLDGFNPLSYSSGLVDALLAQAAPRQQAVKPRPAAKRKSLGEKDSGIEDRMGTGPITPNTTHTYDVDTRPPAGARGECSIKSTRGGNYRPPGFGRLQTLARRPDGFLIDLE